MNRFIKHAEANTKDRDNWFTKLTPKVQSEIIEAAKSWKGPLTKLAEAVKSELNLATSIQQISRRIKDAKDQAK